MLHAGHDELGQSTKGFQEAAVENALPASTSGSGHVAATVVLKAFPQLVGKDLWAPGTFNPTGSLDRSDWLYDPHMVEDDISPANPVYPKVPEPGIEAGPPALPDLVALTTGGYLSPYIDTTEIPGHQLMRFSSAVANQGAGPASLVSANSGTPPAGSGITSWINADGTQNVLQQVYAYDGSSFSFESYRPAGKMVWHSGHSHFHLDGYAGYRLLTKNPDGTPGPVAKRTGLDGSDAVGDKIGFCLINILSSFTIPGTSTSSTTLPGYNKPGQPGTGCGFLQGISTGMADVYDSVYDGQWIDVTGVPNGQYFLEVTLDAQNVILESNENNNVVRVPYTLNTSNAPGGILPDRFEPNNTPVTATDLGVLGVQSQAGLTSHISNEDDYFEFQAASSGAGSVQLVITNRDVNLFLYDSAMNLIGTSSSPTLGTTGSPSTETVNHTFVAGQTYHVRAQGFGTSQGGGGVSSSYTLKVNLNPTINAAAPTQAAETGLSSGTLSIVRNGPTSAGLLVNFTVGGTATRGVDYALYQGGALITGNSVSIGTEVPNADIEVRPIADSFVEANETVILTLGAGAYFLGSTAAATITIYDVPPTTTASSFGFETAQTVSFDFSLNVGASLAASDLVLLNTTTSQIVAATTVQYDALTNRATFGFGDILPDGNYQATIAAASLTHAQGVALAADATLSFFVLAGDLNRDHTVGFDDLLVLAQNYGATGKTFSQGNVNYDAAGTVDFDDLLALAQRYGTTLSLASNSPTLASTKTSARRRGVDVLS